MTFRSVPGHRYIYSTEDGDSCACGWVPPGFRMIMGEWDKHLDDVQSDEETELPPLRSPDIGHLEGHVSAGCELRKASETQIPYRDPRVLFILVDRFGGFDTSHELIRKREMVRAAEGGSVELIAVWPGRWRTEAFAIDDLPAALEAIA